jgi:hypothetical protein
VLFGAAGILAAFDPQGGLSHPIVSWLYYLGTVSAVPAIIAVYAFQWQQAGRLGFIGCLLAMIGAVLYSGPQMALVAGTSGAAGWHDVWAFAMGHVLLIGPGAFFIGLILLGAAVMRGAVLPSRAGLTLAVGSFIWLVAYVLSGVPGLLTIASLITGAGLAWIGWAMWSGRRRETALRQQPAL